MKFDKITLGGVLLLSIILVSTFVGLYSVVWADDHYMSLKYSESFANGCGIAYNCGTPDEGASSIMLIVTIGIAYFFTHGSLYFLAKFIPFLFVIPTIYFMYKILGKYIENKLFLWFSIIFIFLDVNFLLYSVLGTSNMIFQASLFCIIWFFIEDKKFFGIKAYLIPLVFHLFTRQEAIFTLFALVAYEGLHAFFKKDKEKMYLTGALIGIGILFLCFKVWYFGELSSPPSIRKLSSLSGLSFGMVLTNLMNIITTYFYMIPGFIALFSDRKVWNKMQSLMLFSMFFIGAHILIRITILPDVGRYFNQVAGLIFILSMMGYYKIYLSLKGLSSESIMRVILFIILAITAVYSFQQVNMTKGVLASTPVFFAYCPAGEWIKEHSTKDAIVASVEVGCPAYESQREFYDLSGLTDYENARIWKKNSGLFLEQDLNYYQLVKEDPARIVNIPELQPYYNRFFNEVSPDFVFVIHNPPSYVLRIHPSWANYEEVWVRTRQDNFRGYYAVWAKKDSKEVLWDAI